MTSGMYIRHHIQATYIDVQPILINVLYARRKLAVDHPKNHYVYTNEFIHRKDGR